MALSWAALDFYGQIAMHEDFSLDDSAALALQVARHAALANGDVRCGTEYLLYGIVATARDEISELVELFALNTLRIDRAIEQMIEIRGMVPSSAVEPRLTDRAITALEIPRIDGNGRTGIFEVLHGLLLDEESGACQALRQLGVQPYEARRLVSYGLRHLNRAEIDDLLTTLDRRGNGHRAWWGPDPESRLAAVRTPGVVPLEVANSDSAHVEISAFGSDRFGFGFTLTIRSRRDWLLPPVFSPEEDLVPGEGASYRPGPDFMLISLAMPGGSTVDNRNITNRFDLVQPAKARLLCLGQRDEQIRLNDRRQSRQHIITSDWWVWPQTDLGSIELAVDWPAEAVQGTATFDASILGATAS